MKSIVTWGIDNKIIPNFKKKLKILLAQKSEASFSTLAKSYPCIASTNQRKI